MTVSFSRCCRHLSYSCLTGLDDEYRYWSYVEMHPAHVVLTPTSRQEAADALHWSYTDRLLSHPQPVQPPFSQDECQELIRLLNGATMSLHYLAVSDTMFRCRSRPTVWSLIHAHGRANPLARRYVPRSLSAHLILTSCYPAHWRQIHFRPHRPLPHDINPMHTAKPTPILRTTIELVIGVLCLGIPFLFVDRARYSSHFDVENNTSTPSSAPLFVIGACACLVVRTAFIF